MRVGILLAVLWCFSVQANAAPIWTYDLEGTVSGSEEAAGYLADIGVGDSFSIRMSMQKQLDGSHKINFSGSLGGGCSLSKRPVHITCIATRPPSAFIQVAPPRCLMPRQARLVRSTHGTFIFNCLGWRQQGRLTLQKKIN